MFYLNQILPQEFILCDLEYTSWEGSKELNWSRPGEFKEIIEIGAAHVQRVAQRFVICSEFSTFVKPQKNPILSTYIVKLTGITQFDIDNSGIYFDCALSEFELYVKHKGPIISYGEDGKIFSDNLYLNNLGQSDIVDEWMDYRKSLSHALGLSPSLSSSELPLAIGLSSFYGVAHRALDDVRAQIAVLNNLFGDAYEDQCMHNKR
jgi:inhibitor of KinA sporulation pathway (predicted exonuclease)